MKIDDLKGYLEIDRNALDREVSRQPMLYFDIAEQYEMAVAERDASKEELASIDAELDGLYREKYRDEKVTEAVIKNCIQLDKKHEEAFSNFLEAKTKAGKLGALKEAFQQRGYMLRDLASLFVSSYYENTSIQGTNATDDAAYKARRRILSEARVKK